MILLVVTLLVMLLIMLSADNSRPPLVWYKQDADNSGGDEKVTC